MIKGQKNLLISLLAAIFLLQYFCFSLNELKAQVDSIPSYVEYQNDEILVQLKGKDKIYELKNNFGSVQEALLVAKQNTSIAKAEPNYLYHQVVSNVIPNDPQYNKQWYLNQINMPQAWGYTTGSAKTVIAVLDSGVDTDHPDLRANIWRNEKEIAGDNIDNDNNGYVDDINGWDFVLDIADPNPKFENAYSEAAINHGTLVSGIAAASGNNKEGVVGVSWNSKILPLRVLDSAGEGDAISVVKAIDYAIAKKVDVINLSFVGYGDSDFLKAALERAHKAGIAIIAAAGNDEELHKGNNLTQAPMYPICYDAKTAEQYIIGVASTDAIDQKANFSDYGSDCIDVVAPGVDFYTTQVVQANKPGFDSYYGGGWSGTSLSTPLVSGEVALMRSLNPNISFEQIYKIITTTADSINDLNPNFQNLLGKGRINITKALAATLDQVNNQNNYHNSVSYKNGQVLILAVDSNGKNVNFFDRTAKQKGQIILAKKFSNIVALSKKQLIVATDDRGQIWIYNLSGKLVGTFSAYGKNFKGVINISAADVDGDGNEEIITVPGVGNSPHIMIFNERGNIKSHFMAYSQSYKQGLELATADIDGDGKSEIITAPVKNFTPDVRIFSNRGVLKGQFFAGSINDKRGLKIAAADFNGDGFGEMAIFNNGGYQVVFYDILGKVSSRFTPFGKNFKGSIVLNAGDTNKDNKSELFITTSQDRQNIAAYDIKGKLLTKFKAFSKKINNIIQVKVLY